jgi:hypothetical protein
MEIEPRRQAAQKEDSTEALAHRRTIVTVERETLSVLIRRPATEDLPAEYETNPTEASHDLDK